MLKSFLHLLIQNLTHSQIFTDCNLEMNNKIDVWRILVKNCLYWNRKNDSERNCSIKIKICTNVKKFRLDILKYN